MRTPAWLTISLTAVALAITGCTATSPEATEATTTPTPPTADPGLITTADPGTLSVTNTLTIAELRAPSATLKTIVGQVESVPAELVGSRRANEVEGLLPAAGEVFRVVTVTVQPSGDKSLDGVRVGFVVDGALRAQSEAAAGSVSYVVSAPEGTSVGLALTEDGKTQTVDLDSGIRDAATESAGMYWDDPSNLREPMRLPGVEATGALGSVQKAATLTPVVDLEDVSITGWTEEYGWAQDGHVWVTVSGVVSLEVSGDPELRGQATVEATLATGDEQAGSFEVELPRSGGGREAGAEFTHTVGVPADAESLDVKASGVVEVSTGGGVMLTSAASAEAGEVSEVVKLVP